MTCSCPDVKPCAHLHPVSEGAAVAGCACPVHVHGVAGAGGLVAEPCRRQHRCKVVLIADARVRLAAGQVTQIVSAFERRLSAPSIGRVLRSPATPPDMHVHSMQLGDSDSKARGSRCAGVTHLMLVAGLITARASHRGVIVSQTSVSTTSSCRQKSCSRL